MAVVDGDRVPPEDLARDAPILDLLHPPEERPFPAGRVDPDLPAAHRIDDGRREGLHANEPLGREPGFDHGVRAFGPRDRVPVGFGPDQQTRSFELLERLRPRVGPVHPSVLGRDPRAGQVARVVQDVGRHRQARVALVDLVVDNIVARGHLERPRPEGRVDRSVGDDRHLAVGERNDDLSPDQRPVTVVFGVDGDRHVSEDRLGTDGRDLQPTGRAVRPWIAEVDEHPVLFRVDHFEVADRGPELRVPVDHPLSAVDEALLVEPNEHLPGRAHTRSVHRVPVSAPIDREAPGSRLFPDPFLVLLHPTLDLVKRLFARQLLEPYSLLLETTAYLDLGGEAGMVEARNPDGRVAAHPVVAHQDVHDRVPEHVPDGEDPGHVRGWEDEGVGRALGSVRTAGDPLVVPRFLPTRFDLSRLEARGQCRGAQEAPLPRATGVAIANSATATSAMRARPNPTPELWVRSKRSGGRPAMNSPGMATRTANQAPA